MQLHHDGILFAKHVDVDSVDNVVWRIEKVIQLQQHLVGHWTI